MGASQSVPFVAIYSQISSIFAASAPGEAEQEDVEFIGAGEEKEPLTLIKNSNTINNFGCESCPCDTETIFPSHTDLLC